MTNFKELLTGIKTFVFDVDGVLTDGTVTLMPDGTLVRKLDTHDLYALELAISNHFRVAVISRTSSPPLRQTLAGIGITDSYLNASIKKEAFDEFCLTYDLLPADILIMGDDMPDYEIMQLCGVRTCPADAASEIRSLCQYISPRKGGNGCVRDVIEQVLKAQGKWPNK